MLALRQRAACAARRARPTALRNSRSYASESHSHAGHGHAASAEEPMGTAFFIAAGAIPAAMFVYYISRPGKDGERPTLSKFFDNFSYLNQQWETRNTLHTAAIEQAAHDKHLLYYVDRDQRVDLRFPEVFQTGSPYNVPAGHYVNLDKVVAHYRQKHLEEEERKAKKLAV